MSSLWHTPAVVLWLLTWLASPPSSLGEAALRETIRRQATTKSAATLTNIGRDAEPIPAAAVSGMPLPASTADASATTGETKPTTGDQAAKTEPARDEKWWRRQMSDARAMVEKDDLLIESLQSRVYALQNDSVNLDDPLQQNKARQQLSTTLAELENMKKKREADIKAIATLQDDARRANVPAGWVR